MVANRDLGGEDSMRSIFSHRSACTGSTLSAWRVSLADFVLAVTILCASAGVMAAQTREDLMRVPPAVRGLGRTPSAYIAGDTIEVVARRPLSAGAESPFGRPRFFTAGTSDAPRPVPPSLLLRPRTVALSRFACAIYGADRGAGTAAALGGLGLVGGIWGERTAAYMMGAGAVLGALWGGTVGANEPGFRIRIDAGSASSEPSGRRRDPDDRQ